VPLGGKPVSVVYNDWCTYADTIEHKRGFGKEGLLKNVVLRKIVLNDKIIVLPGRSVSTDNL